MLNKLMIFWKISPSKQHTSCKCSCRLEWNTRSSRHARCIPAMTIRPPTCCKPTTAWCCLFVWEIADAAASQPLLQSARLQLHVVPWCWQHVLSWRYGDIIKESSFNYLVCHDNIKRTSHCWRHETKCQIIQFHIHFYGFIHISYGVSTKWHYCIRCINSEYASLGQYCSSNNICVTMS